MGNVLGLAVESRSREAARTRLGPEGPLLRLPIEERDRDWDDDLAMAMALSTCLTRLPAGADRLDLAAIQSAYLAWLQPSGSSAVSVGSAPSATERPCASPPLGWPSRIGRV